MPVPVDSGSTGSGGRRCAPRMADIAPFYVMELLGRAKELEREGRDIVHMEVGEPDFDTPRPIIEAGKRALDAGLTHYTAALGLPALREVISRHYRDDLGVDVAPERVAVTTGASGALTLLMGTLVGPGDRVLTADPGYPCNRHFVRLMEGVPVSVPVGPESAYQLTPELVSGQAEEGFRCVLLASPSNPTGTVVPAGTLKAINQVAQRHAAHLVVDEIYQGLVYGTRAATALALGDSPFVINSFSKYFGMTGWRLGWLVAPEAYVADIERLAQNIFLAAPTPAQYAALTAFEPETRAILEARRAEFQARRDFLLSALRGIGFEIPLEPEGAFYLYADAARFTNDSHAFCLDLLENAGVAVTPGRDFGTHGAGRHVRFAYTTSLERLQEGVERIARYI